MIKAWRTAFNDDSNMPFGIISQETQGEPQTLENFLPDMVDEGNYVREVHYQTFLNLRKAGDKTIGYASSFDQHRAWYHPQLKIQASFKKTKTPAVVDDVENRDLIRALQVEDLKRQIEAARALLKANNIKVE